VIFFANLVIFAQKPVAALVWSLYCDYVVKARITENKKFR